MLGNRALVDADAKDVLADADVVVADRSVVHGNRALVDADAKDVLANANCVGANAVLSGCRDGLDAKRVGADAILS